jgi:hypothetical protein
MADTTKDDEKTPAPDVTPEPVAEEVVETEFVPPHLWEQQEQILVQRYAMQGYTYEPKPYPYVTPVVED